MQNATRLRLPANAEQIRSLPLGSFVLIDGVMYTARDQAHKRIAEAIRKGAPLPFEIKNAAIYYCGPTPRRDGEIIGSCGPTTSGRMDKYTPLLIEHGLNVMIGKGVRNAEVVSAIEAAGAVYLTAVGGAAALYQSRITSCELIAFPELGCEAVYRLTVKDFPAVVSVK